MEFYGVRAILVKTYLDNHSPLTTSRSECCHVRLNLNRTNHFNSVDLFSNDYLSSLLAAL